MHHNSQVDCPQQWSDIKILQTFLQLVYIINQKRRRLVWWSILLVKVIFMTKQCARLNQLLKRFQYHRLIVIITSIQKISKQNFMMQMAYTQRIQILIKVARCLKLKRMLKQVMLIFIATTKTSWNSPTKISSVKWQTMDR